jgi:hypothetical protein
MENEQKPKRKGVPIWLWIIIGLFVFIIIGSLLVAIKTKNLKTPNSSPVQSSTYGSGEPNAQTLLAYRDVKFVLPDNWHVAKGSGIDQEITFVDQSGLSRGGTFLEGYDMGAYLGSTMPNHSMEQSVENIATPLGAGSLVVLERGYPAASGRTDTYKEVWAVIPITKLNMGYPMAYIFWVGVNGSVDQSKSILLQILNHTKS